MRRHNLIPQIVILAISGFLGCARAPIMILPENSKVVPQPALELPMNPPANAILPVNANGMVQQTFSNSQVPQISCPPLQVMAEASGNPALLLPANISYQPNNLPNQQQQNPLLANGLLAAPNGFPYFGIPNPTQATGGLSTPVVFTFAEGTNAPLVFGMVESNPPGAICGLAPTAEQTVFPGATQTPTDAFPNTVQCKYPQPGVYSMLFRVYATCAGMLQEKDVRVDNILVIAPPPQPAPQPQQAPAPQTCRFSDPAYVEPINTPWGQMMFGSGVGVNGQIYPSTTDPNLIQHMNWNMPTYLDTEAHWHSCPTGQLCSWLDNRYKQGWTGKGHNLSKEWLSATIVNPNDPSCALGTVYERSSGCFAPWTKITLADGSVREAKDIRSGALLWNPILKKAVKVRKVVAGPERFLMYEVHLSSSIITVTKTHPLMTATGVKAARELKAHRDFLLDREGMSQEIIEIKKIHLSKKDRVWNFEMETDSKLSDDHAILAEGIQSGDLYVQNHLKEMRHKKLAEVRIQITPKGRCEPGDLDAIKMDVKHSGNDILFTVEDEERRVFTRRKLTLEELQRGKAIDVSFPSEMRDKVGIFLCKDSTNDESCGAKKAADINEIFSAYLYDSAKPIDDRIYYFQSANKARRFLKLDESIRSLALERSGNALRVVLPYLDPRTCSR